MVPCSFDLIFLSNTRIYMAYGWGSPPFTSIQTGGVVVTPRDFTYISFRLFYCPLQECIWFRGGDVDRLQVFKQEGVGMTP